MKSHFKIGKMRTKLEFEIVLPKMPTDGYCCCMEDDYQEVVIPIGTLVDVLHFTEDAHMVTGTALFIKFDCPDIPEADGCTFSVDSGLVW